MSGPDRAVVLGAGIAGLAAAAAVSGRFREVIVVDRDVMDPDEQDELEPGSGAVGRRGTPQDRHLHVLLAGGQNALEGLFPGVGDELVRRGALQSDALDHTVLQVGGHRFRAGASGLTLLSAGRPLIESVLRRRVHALPNVHLVGGRAAVGLLLDASAQRTAGVVVERDDSGGGTESLPAGLVVVATGSGTRLNDWLEANGWPPLVLDTVPIDLTYTSRPFRLREGALGPVVSMGSGSTPNRPRGAALGLVENGRAMVSLMGVLGDQPPMELPGFLDFAGDVALPEVAEALRGAETLGPAARFRHPVSVRRHFERAQLPEGLLILGDALCTLNPAYGQGMTVAAQQAGLLASAGPVPSGAGRWQTRALQRRLARVADAAWKLSRGPDAAFAAGAPRPSPLEVLFGRYLARLQALAAVDPRAGTAWLRVSSLVDPPRALLETGLVRAVVAGPATYDNAFSREDGNGIQQGWGGRNRP
ncbi:hypothetical protein AB0K08_14045 [Citricoccus sp. NPDC055426]|uniref:hypothetical protein n=1 Tax=Citricoccus sp. NPDC055426 TaxID=3155536 RepID=UPI003428B763